MSNFLERALTMPNQIMIIKPYRFAGTWVFDDPHTDLIKEPFVEGIPEIIDQMVRNIPNADQGFRMLFAAESFPGSLKFHWVKDEDGGACYRHDELGTGWLCPALLLYFPQPPKLLYTRAEAIKSRS